MIALVDINNFYVSCERLFNPRLNHKPVVVLSNNDGCIISRSNEAKSLGIKMGEPLFKAASIIKKHNVMALSSNYPLYADISRRVMQLLSTFTDQQEIYSIDESFLSMKGQNHLLEKGSLIRKSLYQWLGMPVCVGIGPTKVLAKFSNHCAKKQSLWKGVFVSSSLSNQELNKVMSRVSVDEIWGIGRRLAEKLKAMGVGSVLDLKHANPNYMKKQFSINMERIVLELNGIQCFDLEFNVEPKKEIIASRSFGKPVTRYDELVEAVTTFVSRGARKARAQSTLCSAVSVFVRNSPFNPAESFYARTMTIPIKPATNHSNLILQAALKVLPYLYKVGVRYSKCGIVLSNLVDSDHSQKDLWSEVLLKQHQLSNVMDEINDRYDKFSLRIATQPIKPLWGMKQTLKTQSFTTSWHELLTVS